MQASDKIKVVVRVKPLEDESNRCLEVIENSLNLTEKDRAYPSTPSQAPSSDPVLPRTPSRLPYTPRGRTPRKPMEKQYNFDRVFENATQNEIYETVLPFIQRAVEGYNATVFAYGQTGAGKTYTMRGEDKSNGIIPRAICSIFEIIDQEVKEASSSDSECVYMLKMTYVELYNDRFRDLLSPDNDPSLQKAKLPDHKEDHIEIKDRNHTIVLTGTDTLMTPITSCGEALRLIAKGDRARAVGATALNARSSRSHAILTFHIESQKKGKIHTSKLNLVDLAGSERLSYSLSEGDRMLEAQHINESLSALADVLSALTKTSSTDVVIPYRNNKLTRLLQDSLGGNALTLMIAAVLADQYRETQSTLMWASRAKMIKNVAKLNLDVDGDSRLIALQGEISDLKRRLSGRNEEYEKLQILSATDSDSAASLSEKISVLARVNRSEKEAFDMQLQEVIYSHKGDIAEQQVAYTSLQCKLDGTRQQVHKLRVQLALGETEIDQLKLRIRKLEQEASDDRDKATTEVEELKAQLATVLSQQTSSSSQEEALRFQLSAASQNLTQANARLADLEKQLSKEKAVRSERDQRLTADEDVMREALEKIKALEAQVKHNEKQAQRDAKKIMTLETDVTTERAKIIQLEQQLQSAKSIAKKAEKAAKEVAVEPTAIEERPVTESTKPKRARKPKAVAEEPKSIIPEDDIEAQPFMEQAVDEIVSEIAAKKEKKVTKFATLPSPIKPAKETKKSLSKRKTDEEDADMDDDMCGKLDFASVLDNLVSRLPSTTSETSQGVKKPKAVRPLAEDLNDMFDSLSQPVAESSKLEVSEKHPRKRLSDQMADVTNDNSFSASQPVLPAAKKVAVTAVSVVPLALSNAPSSLADALGPAGTKKVTVGTRKLFTVSKTASLDASPTMTLFKSFTAKQPKLKKNTEKEN